MAARCASIIALMMTKTSALSLRRVLQHAHHLQLLVEPPPATEPEAKELTQRLVDATGAAGVMVDPVAAPVPALPEAVPVAHVFAPVVYFDSRSSPDAPAPPPGEFAAKLERRAGSRRLLRVVAPLAREADVAARFAGARAVLVARRRGRVDCLYAVEGAPPRLADDVATFWVESGALPEAAAGHARASSADVFVRPTRTDARARLERCLPADDELYWLCDRPDGVQGSRRMLPAGARYVADVNPAARLPSRDVAVELRDAGAIALALRWHTVENALGPGRDWDALAVAARDLRSVAVA